MKKSLPYNPAIKSSILAYAKKLEGHSLKSICNNEIITHQYSGKGNFGQLLEKFYFFYEPNSDSEPDFPEAGVELKTSPLKKTKSVSSRAKERLVLNIINYMEIVNQDFEESSFWKKNSCLLLVFYVFEKEKDVLDYKIRIVGDWTFPESDLEIIKKDWSQIKAKVLAGKAHELSEGDTLYLAACTKGGKGGNPRKQPNSEQLAKQRAFSLKPGYVNHIIEFLASGKKETYGKLIADAKQARTETIENIIQKKFSSLIGKSVEDLVSLFSITINPLAKNYYSIITKKIINSVFNVPYDRELENYIEEFQKADVLIRTVRLKENDMPEQEISFPAFDYKKIVDESWEDSDFKADLEHKFLFIFFKMEKSKLILKKVKFWNMPFEDLAKAEMVWKETKRVVSDGIIVSSIGKDKNGKIIRKTNFPGKKFSSVAHVRPHGINSNDTYDLPKPDEYTKANFYTKHCFWLNKSYVRDKIYYD